MLALVINSGLAISQGSVTDRSSSPVTCMASLPCNAAALNQSYCISARVTCSLNNVVHFDQAYWQDKPVVSSRDDTMCPTPYTGTLHYAISMPAPSKEHKVAEISAG